MALLVLHLAAPLTAPGLQAQDPTPDSAAIADPLTGMTGVTAADSVEVANVLFESSPLDGGLLTDAIATRATECASPLFALACLVSNAGWAHRRSYLDPDQVRRDAERLEVLHEIWGYPDASVQESVTFRDGRAMVRFLIEPGAPLLVESIEIRGLERVAPAIPRPRRLPLAPGEPYALPRLDLIRDWVRDRLAERGRPFGDVEVTGEVDETARRARLVVDVRPGPPAVFGAARLDVEPPLDAALVREALRFRAGDLYRLGALEDSERALYGLDIVDRAILQPAVTAAPPPGSTDTVVVPVSVAVFTRDVHAYDVEAAVSSTECLAGGVFWRHRYFLDGPRLFSAGGGSTHLLAGSLDEGFPCTSAGRGTYAEPQYFVQADLQQPLGSDPRTRLHLGASARREAAPEVYVRRGVRGTLGVSRDVAPSLHGLLRFAPAWNEMDAADAYYCGTYGICDFTGIHELEGPSWLNPVELIASWSPAGEPGQTVVPSELRARSLWGDPGWRPWARAGLEAAGGITGSSFEYVRGIAEAAAVRPFGTALEAGVRVRAAWLSGDRGLPPLVRLYAGGVNSQRGVAENL
ncbi:MAG TPA: hypothetical protein VK966_06955, partial [Longimicrobiales bacterium]|nr:hypothetical protein [Longimicrobiales bacterium]